MVSFPYFVCTSIDSCKSVMRTMLPSAKRTSALLGRDVDAGGVDSWARLRVETAKRAIIRDRATQGFLPIVGLLRMKCVARLLGAGWSSVTRLDAPFGQSRQPHRA